VAWADWNPFKEKAMKTVAFWAWVVLLAIPFIVIGSVLGAALGLGLAVLNGYIGGGLTL
jgi:hypothetical protein